MAMVASFALVSAIRIDRQRDETRQRGTAATAELKAEARDLS